MSEEEKLIRQINEIRAKICELKRSASLEQAMFKLIEAGWWIAHHEDCRSNTQ